MTPMPHPTSWLDTLKTVVHQEQKMPLFGYTPSFDAPRWSETIASFFSLSSVNLSLEHYGFVSSSKALEHIGAGPSVTTLHLPPLNGNLYVAMGKEELGHLTHLLMLPKGSSKSFSSPSFIDGFYRYILLQLLLFLSEEEKETKPWYDLPIKVGPTQAIPQEKMYVMRLNVALAKQTLSILFLFETALLEGFQKHFASPLTTLDLQYMENLHLPLSCEIGFTQVSLSDWDALCPGDLLLLDRCTFDPKTHKGSATLLCHQTPLFRVRLKGDHVKITDYAFYYEEWMDSLEPEQVDHEDTLQETSEQTEASPQEGSPTEILSSREIPLTLHVEIAQLKMNLKQLLDLRPGHLVELGIPPEQNVSLLLEGKKVAVGEIVKIGEVLGVRILKLGMR